jgi:hypothetical protein
MGGAIKITRTDMSAKDLRRAAKRTKDGGIVAGTPAGLLGPQLADDLDIHDATQIQLFPPPQV